MVMQQRCGVFECGKYVHRPVVPTDKGALLSAPSGKVVHTEQVGVIRGGECADGSSRGKCESEEKKKASCFSIH